MDYNKTYYDSMSIGAASFEKYDGEYGVLDREYDWGEADDGTPIPAPCPVCNTMYYACTSAHYNPDEIF